MTPERWQQIEEIFHGALELGVAERRAFLDEKAADDPELRDEVEKLLSQFEEASDFIEKPLYDSGRGAVLSALLDESDDDPMVGRVLGSYRIEREIGRGGMGAVYEAVRADGEFRLLLRRPDVQLRQRQHDPGHQRRSHRLHVDLR